MRKVAAVILAAGGSSRFGSPKQLQIFRGETLVARAVRIATEADCASILVVAGRDKHSVAEALQETSARIIANETWENGIGNSIRCGVHATEETADAIVLLTCDQPLVQAATIRILVTAHENSGKPIVASRYAETLGIPALFAAVCWPELLRLPDDSGAKSIIESDRSRVKVIDFPDGAMDIDTTEDWERTAPSS